MTTRLIDATKSAARPLGTGDFWKRFAQYQLGVALLGLGVAVTVDAGIGLGPWAVFHEGLSFVTGLSFGRILQLVGVAVVGIGWGLTGQRPGLGTVINMLLVGPWVDLFRAQAWFPAPDAYLLGTVQFVLGTVLTGVASGLYITAELGAGPRDGLVLGLARRLGRSVRRTRTGLELVVLACGWLLGGTVGLGTLLFAVLVGPAMQTSLRIFRRGEPRSAGAAAD